MKVGDKVRKTIGFPFTGTIVSDCTTLAGKQRFLVDNGYGMLHVHDPKHLSLDHSEYQYLDLLKELLEKGSYREGRNGGVYSLFGRQMRFNLQEGFPLLTTKKVHFKSIVAELLWMLSGSTNNNDLLKEGVTIWNEWADEDGDLGPIYGKQWRNFSGVDQIYKLIQGLINDPYGRRHVVSAWNPSELQDMSLPPCHCLFQFHVDNGKLSCQLYQRSADFYLGSPFNIASYALLTHLIANETNLEVGDFVYSLGDVHLYANHIEQAKEQLTRTPYPFPEIDFPRDKPMFDLHWKDIMLLDYVSHPAIKAPVSP